MLIQYLERKKRTSIWFKKKTFSRGLPMTWKKGSFKPYTCTVTYIQWNLCNEVQSMPRYWQLAFCAICERVHVFRFLLGFKSISCRPTPAVVDVPSPSFSVALILRYWNNTDMESLFRGTPIWRAKCKGLHFHCSKVSDKKRIAFDITFGIQYV